MAKRILIAGIFAVIISGVFLLGPIWPTDMFCPPFVDYCSEIKGDWFSMWEYTQAVQHSFKNRT